MSILLRRAGSHKTWLIDHRAILDFDYQRGRFFFNGQFYNSIASMVSAGFYSDDAVGDNAVIALPSVFTLFARGVSGTLGTDDGQTILKCSSVKNDYVESVGLRRSYSGGTPEYRMVAFTGGAQHVTLATTSGSPGVDGTLVKFAARVKASSWALSINGGAAVTQASGALPAGLDNVDIGVYTGAVDDWPGTIHRVAVINWDATNAELQAIDGT